jgi:hypothetical protein
MRVIGQIVLLAVFAALGAGVMWLIQPKPPTSGIIALAETSAWPPGPVILPSTIIPPRNRDAHWDFIRECSNPTLNINHLILHGLDGQGRPVVRVTRRVDKELTSSHEFSAKIPAEPEGEMQDHYEVSLSYYHPEEWTAVQSISAMYTVTCGGPPSSSEPGDSQTG